MGVAKDNCRLKESNSRRAACAPSAACLTPPTNRSLGQIS